MTAAAVVCLLLRQSCSLYSELAAGGCCAGGCRPLPPVQTGGSLRLATTDCLLTCCCIGFTAPSCNASFAVTQKAACCPTASGMTWSVCIDWSSEPVSPHIVAVWPISPPKLAAHCWQQRKLHSNSLVAPDMGSSNTTSHAHQHAKPADRPTPDPQQK